MMRYRNLLIVTAAITCVLSACTPEFDSRNTEPLYDNSGIISIDTTNVIGSVLMPQEDDAALTVSPWRAVVDSLGRLHVADNREMVIKSYSADGHLLRTTGGVGSGPGEFRRMSALGIFANDTIVVFDAINKRLTYYDFDTGGTRSVAHDNPLPMSFASLNGDLFAVGFVGQEDDRNEMWIRKIDEDGIASAILSFGSVYSTEESMERWIMQSTPDRITQFRDGLLLTPALFRGTHWYIVPSDSSWVTGASFSAPVWRMEPYSIVDASSTPTDVSATVPGDGVYRANIHNQSRGVHLGAAGRLFHLVELEFNDVLHLVLQIHGPDGSFIGQRILKEQPAGPTGAGYIDAEIAGRPGSNTIYILSRRPNPAIVQVEVSLDV